MSVSISKQQSTYFWDCYGAPIYIRWRLSLFRMGPKKQMGLCSLQQAIAGKINPSHNFARSDCFKLISCEANTTEYHPIPGYWNLRIAIDIGIFPFYNPIIKL